VTHVNLPRGKKRYVTHSVFDAGLDCQSRDRKGAVIARPPRTIPEHRNHDILPMELRLHDRCDSIPTAPLRSRLWSIC